MCPAIERAARSKLVLAGLLTLAVAAAGPAPAADGVLEIHQACAVSPEGCFAGDLGGFPVTLTEPGAYVLTSDLIVSATDTSAISAVPHGVDLDLNGFAVSGPVTCTGSGGSLSCLPLSQGAGITLRDRSSVRNGTVRGFGSSGIQMNHRARLADLLLESNGGDGAGMGFGSIAVGLRARRNALSGLFAGRSSVVDGCTFEGNGYDGAMADDGTLVVSNAALGNGRSGFFALRGSVVHGNAIGDSGVDGISATVGALVTDNVSEGAGRDGINTNYGCAVQGNVVRNNAFFGLRLLGGSGYRENNVSGNGGTVSSGVNAGANACDGTAVCP